MFNLLINKLLFLIRFWCLSVCPYLCPSTHLPFHGITIAYNIQCTWLIFGTATDPIINITVRLSTSQQISPFMFYLKIQHYILIVSRPLVTLSSVQYPYTSFVSIILLKVWHWFWGLVFSASLWLLIWWVDQILSSWEHYSVSEYDCASAVSTEMPTSLRLHTF